jgi:hypothetical protein
VPSPISGRNADYDPNTGRHDSDSREDVASLGAKRAGTTHAAKRAGQATSAATLHEHEEDHKDGKQRQYNGEEYAHGRKSLNIEGKGINKAVV